MIPPQAAPSAELLRSLGRLVRGLSAIFWGLPVSLFVCVKMATTDWARPIYLLGPLFATASLLYGLHLLSGFQKQERIWIHALDRAKFAALATVGLSPFVFWWGQMPGENFFRYAIGVFLLCSLLLIFNLNLVLRRLAAMLPDETLRHETNLFGSVNHVLLLGMLLVPSAYGLLQQIPNLPSFVISILIFLENARFAILVLFFLVPLAMTMTLTWKIKEAVFSSVFHPD